MGPDLGCLWTRAEGASLMDRENEAAFLEKLGEGIAKGTAWERITDLIALENSRESSSHQPLDTRGIASNDRMLRSRKQNDPTVRPRWIRSG